MSNLLLVKANIQDSELLYHWVNDYEVRKNSFNTGKIDYKKHLEWLKERLYSEDTLIYIYKDGQNPIGVIRLEKIDDFSMLINYSIDAKYRGKGYGTKLLALIKKTFSDILLIGKVKTNNISSIIAFQKAGYFIKEEPDYVEFYSKDILR